MVVLTKSALYSPSSEYPDSLVLQYRLYRLCREGLVFPVSLLTLVCFLMTNSLQPSLLLLKGSE